LREPKRKIIHPDKLLQRTNKLVTSNDDWSNIPYYPTTKERREQTVEYLLKTGKQVPLHLLKQIQKDKEDTIREDVYNKNNINEYGNGNDNISSIPINNHHYIQRNLQRQQHYTNSNNRQISHSNINPNKPPNPPHIYSQEYANHVGARPRAAPSARIRLGGVY
jgi:hypothetical protein